MIILRPWDILPKAIPSPFQEIGKPWLMMDIDILKAILRVMGFNRLRPLGSTGHGQKGSHTHDKKPPHLKFK